MELLSYLLGKKSSSDGGGDSYWSAIGYSEAPEFLNVPYNYAKEIYDDWNIQQTNLDSKFVNDTNLVIMPLVDTSKATSMYRMFYNCSELISMPLIDTSNVISTQEMFYNCSKLISIPLLNISATETLRGMFSNCTNLQNVPIFDISSVNNSIKDMFYKCNNLTDESLDNILQTCISATSYTGTKTLYEMGLRSGYYSATKIQALPHYEDFINAGWTIGY